MDKISNVLAKPETGSYLTAGSGLVKMFGQYQAGKSTARRYRSEARQELLAGDIESSQFLAKANDWRNVGIDVLERSERALRSIVAVSGASSIDAGSGSTAAIAKASMNRAARDFRMVTHNIAMSKLNAELAKTQSQLQAGSLMMAAKEAKKGAFFGMLGTGLDTLVGMKQSGMFNPDYYGSGNPLPTASDPYSGYSGGSYVAL